MIEAITAAVRRRRPAFLESYSRRVPLGWRVLAGFVVLFVATWIFTVILGVTPNLLLQALDAPEHVRLLVGGTVARGGMLVVNVSLSIWMLRRITGPPAAALFYPLQRGWWRDLLFGLFIGAAPMALIFVLEMALGWLQVSGWALAATSWPASARTLWLALLVNLLAAAGEEALFRGYLLTGLTRAWGPARGLLLMTLPFAATHLLVSGAAETHWLPFTLLLALPGLLLGWAYLQSGSLWLPTAIHFAWNFFQADVFNLTGEAGPTLVGLSTRQGGPSWLVGSAYGIEVGAAGLVALALVALGVWAWTRATRASVLP